MNSIRLYNYSFSSYRTYVLAGLFVLGNIVFPQLAHLLPNGGPILLPIYFFTLIAAYKYGWRAGILTAVLSPVINYLLFGMPMLVMLPAILIKSTILALAAAYAAKRFNTVNLLVLLLVVASYQILGSLAEWALSGSLYAALQDFRLGLLGMGIQVFGGYAVLNILKS